MAKKKELRTNKLSDEVFNDLYNEVHEKFEDVRKDIYSLMMDDKDSSKAREVMQKAYITYSTVSSMKDDQG